MNIVLRVLLKFGTCMTILLLVVSNTFAINTFSDKSSDRELSRIEQLYIEGKIGLGDKVFYNLQAIYSESSLPENIRSDSQEIVKSATGIILEAY
ncbi:MAG TPA: hypothetical protein ENL22_07910, partial [candidate division Zixibacteria bacterium]|nr:hypothetical protein [candidate division Zixibacteria bacterium]